MLSTGPMAEPTRPTRNANRPMVKLPSTTRRMPMMSSVEEWVDEVARTTRPDRVVWCDGSDAENDRLIEQMVSDGTLIRLNQDTLPNCFLHRSNPQDVARTEHLTFICSEHAADAGPTNNWISPAQAQERIWP